MLDRYWEDVFRMDGANSFDEVDADPKITLTIAFAIKLFGSNSALKKMIDNKLEYQKKKTDKKESPLHADPFAGAIGKIGAMVIDDLTKKATELAEATGRRIVIDVGPVVKEDDKK